MLGLYQCVDQYWYQPVVAAGLGDRPRAVEPMAQGRKLVEDVRARRTDNATAMAHWRSLEAAAKEADDAKAQAMADLGASMRQISNDMAASQPTQCRTTYGQVSSYTTCY